MIISNNRNPDTSLEDCVGFHNAMVEKKSSFIERGMNDIDKQIKSERKKLKEYLAQEKEILGGITDQSSLNDLELIQKKLNELHEQKGGKEKALNDISEITDALNSHKKNLRKLNKKTLSFRKNCTVHHDAFHVRILRKIIQHFVPDSLFCPIGKTSIYRVPFPVLFRQKPPLRPRSCHPYHALYKLAAHAKIKAKH